jgi:Tol biopolymer transport system component
MEMSRTGLLGASSVLAAMLACAVALLVASVKPAEAAFPGQNGDIAFVGNLDGSQADDVFVMGPDGTGLRDLRFLGVYNQSPAFSPNGARLAFDRNLDEWSNGEIVLAKADGSGTVNLTESPDSEDMDPAWFPSGSRVVYCSAPLDEDGYRVGPPQLYAVSFDGSGNPTTATKRLTNNSASDCSPAASPDSASIAFVRSRQGDDSEIWVMRTGRPAGPDNPPLRLTNNSVDDRDPDWSPDGSKIVYESGGVIRVMSRDGDAKRSLGSGYDPAFSPDGKRIAFVDVVDGKYGIWKMRADGTGRSKLTDDEGYAGFPWFYVYGPTWQPLP